MQKKNKANKIDTKTGLSVENILTKIILGQQKMDS